MSFLEVIKGILFDVSSRDGYFGGSEGVVRMSILIVIILAIGIPVYLYV